MNEDHNSRLSTTIDKLLSESNERLQLNLRERMHAIDEKNSLQQELDQTRKELETIKIEKSEILNELSKYRLECETLKRKLFEQEISYSIQQTDALTRSLSPSNILEQSAFSRSSSNHTVFESHSLPRRSNSCKIRQSLEANLNQNDILNSASKFIFKL